MDFIERLFGISPDGGDGSTEVLVIGAIVLAIAALTWRWLHVKGLGGRLRH
jgi:hypothetical protein